MLGIGYLTPQEAAYFARYFASKYKLTFKNFTQSELSKAIHDICPMALLPSALLKNVLLDMCKAGELNTDRKGRYWAD